jgi:hypothetical protein
MAAQGPNRRQVEVLRANIAAGSVAAAAFKLGISESTARQHLSGLYRRTGCLNAAQAAYWLASGPLARSSKEYSGERRGLRPGSVPTAPRSSPGRSPPPR